MSKKRSREDDGDEERDAKLNSCCKEAFAKVMCAGTADERAILRKMMERSGYGVNRTTVYRWMQRFNSPGTPVDGRCNSGRPQKLDESHLMLIAGHILWHNSQNITQDAQAVHSWVQSDLDVDCSVRTIRNAVCSIGFSCRRVRRKRSGYQMTADGLARLYQKFINDVARPIFSQTRRHLILSIDCVYASYQNENSTAFAFRGG